MSKPKTIAQLSLTKAWGGLEMSTVKFARIFKERGYHSVGISQSGAPMLEKFAELEIPSLGILAGGRPGYFEPRGSWALRRFLIDQKVDVLFCHHLRDLWVLFPALFGLPNLRVFGVARMFIRGISKKDFLHRRIYGRLEKLVALSEIQKHLLMECLPVSPERCVVIPNGIDVERFKPQNRNPSIWSTQFNLPQNARIVGLIGRVDPQKGHREFVLAAAQLARDITDVHFVVIGEESAGEAGFLRDLKDLIRREKLEQRIHFLGHQTGTPDLMASLDVFAMPSYEENFGNVTLEAMASGVPIVATDSGGTPDVVGNGLNGVLVPPRNAEALAKGIRELLENQDLAHKLARAARERAESTFAQSKVFDRVEELIRG